VGVLSVRFSEFSFQPAESEAFKVFSTAARLTERLAKAQSLLVAQAIVHGKILDFRRQRR
jgi:hypothetical protein